jgi:sugar lactone lactonase YvrE
MALVLADRVRETTAVVGTGTATLLGAIASYQSFAAIGNGNTVYYTIVDQSTGEWEVGIGTYTASGTLLARTTVLSSSNAGALVNFPAGTKDVWGDYPAGKAVTTDTLAYPPAIGGTTPAAGTFTEVAVITATGESAFNENDTITGWLYSGNSFSVSAQETTPNGLFIGSAGTKMYVNGSTGDDVNEYTLGTAWNITTAAFVTAFSTTGQDTAPADLFFKPDGTEMYVLGDTNNSVFQYTLGTAWSIATAAYASKSFSVAAQDATPAGLWFKPDGTVMYVVGSATDSVYQYALATAWDVSTASYGGIFYSVAVQETSPSQVNLSADGTKMWILGIAGDDIWEYSLGTAWNVSTATPFNNFYVGFQETGPTGMFIDSTAPNRVYIVGSTTADTVFQYNTANNSLKLDAENLNVEGALRVQGALVVNSNTYVDGNLGVQGSVVLGTLSVGSTTITGTPNLGTGTGALTVSLGAGATTSGSLKTINIGTAGVSGSTTNINIGSAVSGATSTTTLNGLVIDSISAAVSAAGATQATATALVSNINNVTVVAAAANGVRLPTAVAGMRILVRNSDALDTLNIYPATGGQINALGANTASTLVAGLTVELMATTTTQWYTF